MRGPQQRLGRRDVSKTEGTSVARPLDEPLLTWWQSSYISILSLFSVPNKNKNTSFERRKTWVQNPALQLPRWVILGKLHVPSEPHLSDWDCAHGVAMRIEYIHALVTCLLLPRTVLSPLRALIHLILLTTHEADCFVNGDS